MAAPFFYAGIGSRQTPDSILRYMHRAAVSLAKRGFILRSGAANGADAAFEAGCLDGGGKSEIWLPWKGFNEHSDTGFYPTEGHSDVAAGLHPAWNTLTRGPRALHSRNVGQVLGSDLASPVSFILCYTPDGATNEQERTRNTGGTGTAIVLASRHCIPVFNLANPDARRLFVAHVAGIISHSSSSTTPA